MKKSVVALVFLGAVTGVGLLHFKPFAPLEDKMSLAVLPDDPRCGTDNPVLLQLTNNSRYTVERTAVEVAVKEIGFSRDLERERFDTDKIIKPGESYSMCVSRPETVHVVTPIPGLTRDTYSDYPADRLQYDGKVVGAWNS